MRKLAVFQRVLTLAMLLAGASTALAGPVSRLYASTGSSIDVWQGNAIVDTWATGSLNEHTIAVDSTVRTYAQALGQTGYEYGLGGTPTGVTYTNTAGCCFRDGTTDGVHNYASSDAGLFQFNTDWTNPQLLGSGSDIGIAYDRTSDSFWYAGGVLIYNVSRTGDILNAFYLNHSVSLLTRALALDPVDHTLWLFNYVPFASYFEQYSTAPNPPGVVIRAPLSTLFVGSNTYLSAEFALNPNAVMPIPEPASVALMLIGMLGLAASRRRVRSL